MNWGRTPKNRTSVKPLPYRTSIFSKGTLSVLLGGIFLCLCFFCGAVSSHPEAVDYPAEKAAAARDAFGREHTALTAVLGIDSLFPEEAVYAGAFPQEPQRWKFSDYMRDALYHFVFGQTP